MNKLEYRAIAHLQYLQSLAQKASPAYADYELAISALRDRIDGKLISFADKPIIPTDQDGRQYIEDGDIRLIVQDGVYQGWYRPNRGEE